MMAISIRIDSLMNIGMHHIFYRLILLSMDIVMVISQLLIIHIDLIMELKVNLYWNFDVRSHMSNSYPFFVLNIIYYI